MIILVLPSIEINETGFFIERSLLKTPWQRQTAPVIFAVKKLNKVFLQYLLLIRANIRGTLNVEYAEYCTYSLNCTTVYYQILLTILSL